MARPWSIFSALDRGEKNKISRVWVGSLILGITSMGASSWASSEAIQRVRSQASPEPTSMAVALFDLERLDHLKPTERPRVGDQMQFRIHGWAPTQNLKFEWADPQLNLSETGWDRVEKPLPPSASDEYRIWVVPIRPGQLTFPPFILKDQQGREVARSTPVQVEILSGISAQDPEPDQPNDLEPPVGLKFPLFWVILFGGLGLALVVGVGYGIWRRSGKSRKRLAQVKQPRVPEDEVALSRLSELEQRDYWAHGDYKKHYFGVSEIIKAYVGTRYRIDALEATTREMVSALFELTQVGPPLSEEVSDERITELKKLFSLLDRVKFTDFQPKSAEALEVLQEARRWVETTRRVPEPVSSQKSLNTEEWAENAVR